MSLKLLCLEAVRKQRKENSLGIIRQTTEFVSSLAKDHFSPSTEGMLELLLKRPTIRDFLNLRPEPPLKTVHDVDVACQDEIYRAMQCITSWVGNSVRVRGYLKKTLNYGPILKFASHGRHSFYWASRVSTLNNKFCFTYVILFK